jgi:hypothetical protein
MPYLWFDYIMYIYLTLFDHGGREHRPWLQLSVRLSLRVLYCRSDLPFLPLPVDKDEVDRLRKRFMKLDKVISNSLRYKKRD